MINDGYEMFYCGWQWGKLHQVLHYLALKALKVLSFTTSYVNFI